MRLISIRQTHKYKLAQLLPKSKINKHLNIILWLCIAPPVLCVRAPFPGRVEIVLLVFSARSGHSDVFDKVQMSQQSMRLQRHQQAQLVQQ